MALTLAKALRRTLAFRAADALGVAERPLKLRLAVTSRCNARCKMCSAWKSENRSLNELTLDEYERIFSENANYFRALRHVALTGGEPLLRPDLRDIIGVVHRRLPDASLNVNTNGFRTEALLSLARSLAEEGIRVAYNVSLDALNEIHDRMRGVPRASRMAIRSIEGLCALRDGGLRLKVNANFTITEDNAGAAQDVFNFCRQNRMEFNPIMPAIGELYKNEGVDLSLSAETRARLAEFFAERLREGSGDCLAYSVILDQLRGEAREFRCWAGRIIVLIEENGDVFPNGGCPRTWALGNLREHDYRMDRLLASDQARRVQARVRECRACRLPCEALTTLKYPEAWHAYQRTRRARAARPAGQPRS